MPLLVAASGTLVSQGCVAAGTESHSLTSLGAAFRTIHPFILAGRELRVACRPILRLARYCPREQGNPLPAVVCGDGLLTYFGERKRQGMERLPSTLQFAAPGLRVGSGGRGGVTGNVA
jgi:hypothetical protein